MLHSRHASSSPSPLVAIAVKAEIQVKEVKREQEAMTPARVREITNAMLPKLMALGKRDT
jgi:hypothetical protein